MKNRCQSALNGITQTIKTLALLLVLLMCCEDVVWAAKSFSPTHPDPILESWRWRSFPELKGQDVRCLTEDQNGSMWFGTKDGVWSYNGLTWTVFGSAEGLDGGAIGDLMCNSDGQIYATSKLGIYVNQSHKWKRIFPRQGDFPWYFHDLSVDQHGDIWVGSAWGVVRLSGAEVVFYSLREILSGFGPDISDMSRVAVPDTLVTDRDVSYQGIGIQRIDDAVSWVIAGSPADSAGLRIGDRVQTVRDQASESVLGVQRDGERRYEAVIAKRPGSGVLKEFEIYDILHARDGSVWLGLATGLIVRLDPMTGVWRGFGAREGLQVGAPVRLCELKDGQIWAVTEARTQGVQVFDGQRWQSFKVSEHGGTDVNASVLQTQDGTVWVGGNEGHLHARRHGTWVVYQTPYFPLPETRIVSLLEGQDGALWIVGQGSDPVRIDYATERWTTYGGLNFVCEDTHGTLWFVSQNNDVVSFDGQTWLAYGVDDGLMDAPTGGMIDRDGQVWMVGSHHEVAAIALFDGAKWQRRTFPTLSWGIDSRGVYSARDGSVWLGAAVDWSAEKGHLGGVIQLFGQEMIHHKPPTVLRYIYGLGQSQDGRIWIGSYRGLHTYDGLNWSRVDSLAELQSRVDVVYTPDNGDLWLGHRTRGVFYYDGQHWTNYTANHGLPDNTIRSILQTQDGTVWAVTTRGIARYDGDHWSQSALPVAIHTDLRGNLKASSNGNLWINTVSDAWHRRAWPARTANRIVDANMRVMRYVPDKLAPQTEITISLNEVSQPGNTTIAWNATDPWHDTADPDLLYAWQLDDHPWSPFETNKNHVFQLLKSGQHTFRVKARDRNFNVDPSPATLSFVVLPPVWKQPWFIMSITVLVVIIAMQTTRVIRRDRRLQMTNDALSQANNELVALNLQLQTTNKHLEETREQLILQEKMVSLGNLVAGIAHEMNTPLGALGGAVDVMRRCIERIGNLVGDEDVKRNPNYQRAMSLLESNAKNVGNISNRVSRIVNSLRNFSRLDESAYQRVNLHDGIESILLLRESDLGNRIQVTKTYGDIPPVACYPGELNQVFMNVFSNAIEAIPRQGEIRIVTESRNGWVRVVFEDSGQGISEEDLPRVFDPGFTTKGVGVGVGLGLAICYRVIQKHGGKIWFERLEERGTRCVIEIPVERTDPKS